MTSCPKCKSSWIDKNTGYKREIGIDGGYIGIYDGIVAIMCPDCKEVFPRNASGWAEQMFEKYKKYITNNN